MFLKLKAFALVLLKYIPHPEATMTSVFDFKDYRQYLLSYIKALPQEGRGFRKLMAETIGCQMGFITQMFNETSDLSLEQAHLLKEILGHNEEELDYFLTLVQYNRAGTAPLKNTLLRQIQSKRKIHLDVQNKTRMKNELSMVDMSIYYSDWKFAAVHMIVTIPQFQNFESIQNHFHFKKLELKNILDFLIQAKLVSEKNGFYRATQNQIFLEKNSPLVKLHHNNWRNYSILNNHDKNEINLAFTQCFTISENDAHKLREMILKNISEYIEHIKPSPEEKLMAMNIDLFEV